MKKVLPVLVHLTKYQLQSIKNNNNCGGIPSADNSIEIYPNIGERDKTMRTLSSCIPEEDIVFRASIHVFIPDLLAE